MDFKLNNEINTTTLIDYGLFSIIDNDAVRIQQQLSDLEASDKLINLKLRTIGWSGIKELVDNTYIIGYASKKQELADGVGMLEQIAYNTWIEEFKDTERMFKTNFPLPTLSQSQYDALLSLYFDTGTYRKVGTELRQFELSEFITDRKWDHVATSMTLSGSNRLVRQYDAKVLMLADYGTTKDRSLIKEQGLQTLLKRYSTMGLTDPQKAQAEYVYYAETKRFLPNLAESRKRILVKQSVN